MLAIKRLAGVVPEVNLKEGTSHTSLPRANKATYSGFERDVPRTLKTGVCPIKRHVSTKNFKNKKQHISRNFTRFCTIDA